VQEERYHETSQLILDTSLNSVYDTRLRVKGRKCGTYNCTIGNNIRYFLPEASITEVIGSKTIIVAREPTNLTTVIPESNSTHVNITVSWESQDYVVYYQPKGGPVISDRVSGGETDTHSLDGLQRGVTYYISIVALSPHLPSPLVGPITVIANPPLIYVETSPESLTTSPNTQFSVNCTARAEVDGQSIPVDIEWIRIAISPPSGPSELMPTLYTTTGSPERGYQSVLTTSENDTIIVYRCTAKTLRYSESKDTTAFIRVVQSPPSNVNGCTSFVTLTTTVTSSETATVVSSTSIKPSTTLQITGTATVAVNKTVTPAEDIALSSHSSDTRLFSPTTTPASNSNMVIATSVTSASVITCAEDIEPCTRRSITPTRKNMVIATPATPVSETCSCTKDVDKEPCSTESTAVIAGGVGGGIILCQILVCLPIAIFCICNRYLFVSQSVTWFVVLGWTLYTELCICHLYRSAYSKKMETHSNTAYGVVPARREEPVYDVINQPLNQSAAKLPLSSNVATASTAM
ncbi:hypothetical protein GBAR_LOCUS8789, partial [Geodia barretti]